MSEGTELTLKDAQAVVDSLSVADELKNWGKRTDGERLAIGIMVLSHTMKGKSLRSLEGELGVSYVTLHRYKERALMAIATPTIEAARTEELARLDRIIELQWPRVERGDTKAIELYLKVSERRAKLLGLDRPIQVESVIHEITPQERELARLVEEAKQKEQQDELEILDEPGV